MEGLIHQAFANINAIGKEVEARRYDLIGPHGEIILPQVWETMVHPDMEIEMRMWPPPEPKRHPVAHGHGHGHGHPNQADIVAQILGQGTHKAGTTKKKGTKRAPPPPP